MLGNVYSFGSAQVRRLDVGDIKVLGGQVLVEELVDGSVDELLCTLGRKLVSREYSLQAVRTPVPRRSSSQRVPGTADLAMVPIRSSRE